MQHLLIIIIITGHSGSGKSTALAAVEDAGLFCVDNMPVALLPKFLEIPIESDYEIAGLAFVMDLRERAFLSEYPTVLQSLQDTGYRFEIIFLEASEETLVQRYSQTRRHHPLSKNKTLLEGIRAERTQLKALRTIADHIIDTSDYTVHDLKAFMRDIAQKSKKLPAMQINVLSFGFKFGIPYDADLIMDVRFLENPYFVTHLKALDGTDEAVRSYIFNDQNTDQFLKKYLDLLDYLIPLYEKEGKAYLTIAVGCTGGRHRSVTIAQAVFEHIQKSGQHVDILHRDLEDLESSA